MKSLQYRHKILLRSIKGAVDQSAVKVEKTMDEQLAEMQNFHMPVDSLHVEKPFVASNSQFEEVECCEPALVTSPPVQQPSVQTGRAC